MFALAVAATVPCAVVAQERGFTRLDDVLAWKDELRPHGMDVELLPVVAITPHAELIVAGLTQTDLKKYNISGQLRVSVNEDDHLLRTLDRLSFAIWIPGDSLVGYSVFGAYSIFDSAGIGVRTGHTGLARLYAGRLINDSTVLLAGRIAGSGDSLLLHEWNLRHQVITRSFFSVPPHDSRLEVAYRFSGAVAVDERADSIVATFARADTLYIFREDGQPIEKLRIPFINFRVVREPPPDQGDVESRIRWRASFSAVSQVFWAPDGTFFVQYYNFSLVEPRWGLLHMSRDGSLLFDVADAPRLLAVLPGYRLLFVSSEEENLRWKVAELRVVR